MAKKHAADELEQIDDRADSKQVAALKARVKQLERLVEQQQESIERQAKAKYRLPKAPAQACNKAFFRRIVIPDTHGDNVEPKALAAFLKDLEGLASDVREIVMLGDHLDCGGFLAEHHTLGYVAETLSSYEDDYNATNTLLDELQRLCPKAAIHYLMGNHERRVEKWCLTESMKARNATSKNRELILRNNLKLYAPENVLHLEQRNIHTYKQGVFYQGLQIPATIKLGSCHFTHGSRTCKNPAAAMLKDFSSNVVFGHVHAIDSDTMRTVHSGVISAYTPGCLAKLQPYWMHTQITKWAHGYGLQMVRNDGDFLHLNVPIIDGKSYLMQLAEPIGA